ncbi:hypothetical protein [Paraliobacillus sediminis]|uniref:hypothetical protein n=1 Tax=Paraliobacillus sediminis TaxID=1885916 RepID=UPI000E3C61C2|nr:hypothetical protein [Paraliobacillus sediminis]
MKKTIDVIKFCSRIQGNLSNHFYSEAKVVYKLVNKIHLDDSLDLNQLKKEYLRKFIKDDQSDLVKIETLKNIVSITDSAIEGEKENKTFYILLGFAISFLSLIVQESLGLIGITTTIFTGFTTLMLMIVIIFIGCGYMQFCIKRRITKLVLLKNFAKQELEKENNSN